jgi:proteasome lid subunit RPN8/RPN11
MYYLEIEKYAKQFPREECCGLIVLNKEMNVEFVPMLNQEKDKENNFLIDPYTFLKHKLTSTVLGIFHSHHSTGEKPSVSDINSSEESGIPYLIYSLKTQKFFLYYPESYKPSSLMKRPYIKGFYECICLVKDYYKQKTSIDTTKWNDNYWLPTDDKKANKKLLKILSSEMSKIDIPEIKKDDLLLFDINNKRLHVGVYLGGDEFLHQPLKKLSQVDVLDQYWQSKLCKAYRHKELV